jgi:hypothetical protein
MIKERSYSAKAYFYPDDGSVKILKGSLIKVNDAMANKYPEIERVRKELYDSEVLCDTEEGAEFAQDYLFTSSRETALSSTASLILYGSRNGKEHWKTEDGNPIGMLMQKENS